MNNIFPFSLDWVLFCVLKSDPDHNPQFEPINPVIQNKFGLNFVKESIFKIQQNTQKTTKIRNTVTGSTTR